MQTFFRGAIRVVFLFAFIAFLSASISHVAVFFNDFEADKGNWIEPYMLAISIDLTALVLTVGVMFFRKGMPWYAVLITWVFIFALTTFSWIVNWEYASTYQGNTLHVNGLLSQLNPVLASSFAFFNLVYSFVSEFFNAKVKTSDELKAELDRLEALEEIQNRIKDYRERTRKPGLIQRAKGVAIEAKTAVKEVLEGSAEAVASESKTSISEEVTEEVQTSPEMEMTPPPEVEPLREVTEEMNLQENGTDEEVTTDPGVEVFHPIQFPQNGSSHFPKTSIKERIARKRLFTIAQAAEELQCTPRHVRNLRKDGTLAADDSGLIVGSSLKAYAAKRKTKAN
jgi:hypothetical protein